MNMSLNWKNWNMLLHGSAAERFRALLVILLAYSMVQFTLLTILPGLTDSVGYLSFIPAAALAFLTTILKIGAVSAG